MLPIMPSKFLSLSGLVDFFLLLEVEDWADTADPLREDNLRLNEGEELDGMLSRDEDDDGMLSGAEEQQWHVEWS